MKNKRPINYHKHKLRQEACGWVIICVLVWMVLLVLATSCSTSYRGAISQADSIYIEKRDTIIYRDTIIQIQMRDSIVEDITHTHELSHLETDIAISDAWVVGDSLHHTLRNKQDLISVEVNLPKSISHEKHYILRKITAEKEVVKPLKWHQEALMFLGKIMIFALVALIIRFFIQRHV